MNRIAMIWCAALLTIVIGACGGTPEPPPDPNAPVVHQVTPAMMEQGKATYMANCAPCHGPEGKGDGPASATLNPKPRNHSNSEYMDALTDQKVADTVRMGGIISGYPNMPSSPHITGDDVPALIAYVRSLGHPEGIETVTLKPR